MQTVPHPQAGENRPPLTDLRPAQYVALRRWHDRDALCEIEQSLAAHPFFPLIDGCLVQPAQ